MKDTINYITQRTGFPFHFAAARGEEINNYLQSNNCLRLLSYVNERKLIEDRLTLGDRIFVDSGAFSATNRKLSIDVDKYITWLNEWHENISMYCCWDSIPVGDLDPEECAKKTWDNYLYMKQRVKAPEKLIYCYHYGEDIKWLEQALESGVKLVALGGVAKRGKNQRIEFFDKCRPLLEKHSDVFVHAFGMTSLDVLARYHYIDSADSSSWMFPAKYGNIQMDAVKVVYFGEDKSKDKSYYHLELEEQILVDEELAHYGYTVEDMKESKHRTMWQIMYWDRKMKKVEIR